MRTIHTWDTEAGHRVRTSRRTHALVDELPYPSGHQDRTPHHHSLPKLSHWYGMAIILESSLTEKFVPTPLQTAS
jgi:hypothetical protein